MKRALAAAMLALCLVFTAPVARAYEDDRNDESRYEDAFSNPLRLAYYLIYPIGFTTEWLVMRPLHYLISRPYLNHFFGYTPIGEEGQYQRVGERMGEHM